MIGITKLLMLLTRTVEVQMETIIIAHTAAWIKTSDVTVYAHWTPKSYKQIVKVRCENADGLTHFY